jgi:cobalt/nickel transport protein
MQKPSINVWLLTGAAVLSLAPVLIHQGKEFKATDSINVTAIEQVQPGYKPWFEPIIKPSGGEVETFLFATQAAIGSGVTCYIKVAPNAAKPKKCPCPSNIGISAYSDRYSCL